MNNPFELIDKRLSNIETLLLGIRLFAPVNNASESRQTKKKRERRDRQQAEPFKATKEEVSHG